MAKKKRRNTAYPAGSVSKQELADLQKSVAYVLEDVVRELRQCDERLRALEMPQDFAVQRLDTLSKLVETLRDS